MQYKERRAFHGKTLTPEMREVARMRNPMYLHYKGKMVEELRRKGWSESKIKEQIDLRMMLHDNPRVAKLAMPITKISKEDVDKVLTMTRGLL